MSRLTLRLPLSGLVLSASFAACSSSVPSHDADCSGDLDCKGDRIWEDGVCIDPNHHGSSGPATGSGGAAPACQVPAGCSSVASDCMALTDNAQSDKAALRISQ